MEAESKAIKGKLREARDRRKQIAEALTDPTLSKDKRISLRIEDARLSEDCITYSRDLRKLMPSHHVTAKAGRSGSAAVISWDVIGAKKWKEMEAETNSEEIKLMAKAVRSTMEDRRNFLSETQDKYLAATGNNMEKFRHSNPQLRSIGASYGVDSSTVSRTVNRARSKIQREAKMRYEALKIACETENVRLDVSDKETMWLLLSLLTERQACYMLLYYGEWLSTHDIGVLLGVDHSTVVRTIRRGLEKMAPLVGGNAVTIDGIPALETAIIEHLNDLPTEPMRKSRKKHRLYRHKRKREAAKDVMRLDMMRKLLVTVPERCNLKALILAKQGIVPRLLGAILALKKILKKGMR